MSAAHRYVDVRNTTASKERLMVMLFEAALRHMRTAARHLENKDRKTAAPLIEKACQIVLELQSTLKPEIAPKLTQSLIEIYTFTAARLCRANLSGDVTDLRQAERAFAPIVDGFAQAVAALGPNGAPAPAAATLPPGAAGASTGSGTVKSGTGVTGGGRPAGPTVAPLAKQQPAASLARSPAPAPAVTPAPAYASPVAAVVKAPVVAASVVASRYPRVAR